MTLNVFLFILLFCLQSVALTPRDPHYIMRYYNHFVSLGVPAQPLNDTLLYLMENWGQSLKTELKKQKLIKVKITNSRFVGIIDFNKSSLEKRFWILDLKTGQVRNHWVSHGANTGGIFAYQFSNELGTRQSSLGFYLTGPRYVGKFGKSLKLYGLSESNDQVYDRDIVLHPSNYVSYQFAYRNLRLGRSFGCLAISYDSLNEILKTLPTGSLIYTYHDQLYNRNLEKSIPSYDNPELTEEEKTQ